MDTGKEKNLDEVNIDEKTRLLDVALKEERDNQQFLANSRNLLKIRDVLKSCDTVQRAYLEEMKDEDGVPMYVEYCALNVAETKGLRDIDDPQERLAREVYLRVKKADPAVEEDDILGLPDYLIQLIMIKVREQEDYRFLLPALQRNLDTLRQIQRPNGSLNSVTDST